ncbi:hypothetical protein AD998_21800 [bacterium 336/3]|nr:hypothetical protein AD998_21800 [bacterium 336/3]
MKLNIGQIAPEFTTEDIMDMPVSLNAFKGKKVYISFLRNTRCPMCSLHVYKIFKKSAQLKTLNIETIIFYESDKKMFKLSDFFQKSILSEHKFSVVSDTKRIIYSLYGLEVLPPDVAHEKFIAANRQSQIAEIIKLGITGDGIEPGTNVGAMPADFLIDENQILQLVHYGKDGGDQIDLDEIIKFATENAKV